MYHFIVVLEAIDLGIVIRIQYLKCWLLEISFISSVCIHRHTNVETEIYVDWFSSFNLWINENSFVSLYFMIHFSSRNMQISYHVHLNQKKKFDLVISSQESLSCWSDDRELFANRLPAWIKMTTTCQNCYSTFLYRFASFEKLLSHLAVGRSVDRVFGKHPLNRYFAVTKPNLTNLFEWTSNGNTRRGSNSPLTFSLF